MQSDEIDVTRFLDADPVICSFSRQTRPTASAIHKLALRLDTLEVQTRGGAPGLRPLRDNRLLRPRGSEKDHFVLIHPRRAGSARSCSTAIIRYPDAQSRGERLQTPTPTPPAQQGVTMNAAMRAGEQVGKHGTHHGETYSRRRGSVHEAIEAGSIWPAGGMRRAWGLGFSSRLRQGCRRETRALTVHHAEARRLQLLFNPAREHRPVCTTGGSPANCQHNF